MMLARRDSIHNRVIPFLSCIVSVIVIVTVYCTCCVVFVVVVVASSFFVGYFLVNDRAPLVKNFQNYGFCCCFCAFVELSTIEIVEIYSHIHWIRGQFEISVRYNHHFVCTLTRFLSISISLKYTHIHSIAYTHTHQSLHNQTIQRINNILALHKCLSLAILPISLRFVHSVSMCCVLRFLSVCVSFSVSLLHTFILRRVFVMSLFSV